MDYRIKPRHTGDSLIAQARLKAGLTQAELAERIGVGQKMITAWETGYRKPKLDTIRKIATALGIDWLTLIE